jgi:hypothetical protein
MHLTYDQLQRLAAEDGAAAGQLRQIPFAGFVNGVLIGMALWAAIGWVVWSLVA